MIKCDACGKEAEKCVQWSVTVKSARNNESFGLYKPQKLEEYDLCDSCIGLATQGDIRSLRELRAEVEHGRQGE